MNIQLERLGRVVIARINRPEALNALNADVMDELVSSLSIFDRDPDIGCMVITGSDKVFAAGADIKEMKDQTFQSMFYDDYFAGWESFTALRTPKIAAVSGYAFGGGCELAMMCDFILAADNAVFGQPEIKLGVVPGMGGTQRLTRLVGKAKAMDIILTGRHIEAIEAERIGLAARVFALNNFIPQVLEVANHIATFSKPALMMAREQVDRALEVSLREGLLYERRTFHSLFATQDQKEGMQAFTEKRPPNFTGQ
ncbi:enoyl-CoA hydratase-related protein [Pleionea sp. CnH1-48]|uniref:enoyl-CoA hydratase-related protein n=1 Tax=Pleionea sp. CnH1-48 TaxID=2954494 RepID=UPI0020971AD2|nr:enoyl-CoA hydratase-related protein [Pleionea sp. CnH1-48]MCO7227492.1 enoyl-CoA hydratase-related protein [Pleionea sp. CnH1-48]